MNESRRKSTGGRAPQRAARKTDRSAPAAAATCSDPPRPDERLEPYRAELVARLEQAVREGRYQPDPRAIAAAMIDRMDSLLG
jgi:anti-sigma28 factor (negative regulator of flagellin synthesis)